jgi:hypothetical protein
MHRTLQIRFLLFFALTQKGAAPVVSHREKKKEIGPIEITLPSSCFPTQNTCPAIDTSDPDTTGDSSPTVSALSRLMDTDKALLSKNVP